MNKILFVVNVDWYFKLHWLSRVQACRASGYEVYLACQFSSDVLLRELEELGIRCYPLQLARTSLNPVDEVRSLWQIRRVVRLIQPDLIHTITIKANIYGGLIATANSIPLVSTVAGRGWSFSNTGLKAGLVSSLVKRLYRHIFRHTATRVVFENPDDREYFVIQGLLTHRQARVILGAGVDPVFYKMIPADKILDGCILFASRMLKSKGLDTLVAACDLLRERGRTVRLRVAGILDENQQDALPLTLLEQWADQGQLEWLGQRDDIPELIGESLLVALPTRYGEGIPRVLIEAAASGRALLATDVPGCREIVRHNLNGKLVSVEATTEEWADVIDDLLSDFGSTVRMGTAGRRMVEAEFTDAKVCSQTLEIYRELAVVNGD